MNFSKNVNRFFFIFEVNFTYEKIIDFVIAFYDFYIIFFLQNY